MLLCPGRQSNQNAPFCPTQRAVVQSAVADRGGYADEERKERDT